MINEDLIAGLPEDARMAVQMAILTLAEAGILGLEVSRRESELLHGDSDEEPLELAQRIKEHRLIAHQLEELQQLGVKYGERS